MPRAAQHFSGLDWLSQSADVVILERESLCSTLAPGFPAPHDAPGAHASSPTQHHGRSRGEMPWQLFSTDLALPKTHLYYSQERQLPWVAFLPLSFEVCFEVVAFDFIPAVPGSSQMLCFSPAGGWPEARDAAPPPLQAHSFRRCSF